MLFDQKALKEAAIDLILAVLEGELRASPTLRALAENIDAIGTHYAVPIEETLAWIRTPALGKRWTAAEFRRWCIVRAEALEKAHQARAGLT